MFVKKHGRPELTIQGIDQILMINVWMDNRNQAR